MTQFLLKLESDSEIFSCIAMPAGEPGLGLDIDRIAWQSDTAPVQIYVDNNELRISHNPAFASNITILRNGRSHSLVPGKSIRLLAKDQIQIGEKVFTIQSFAAIQSPRTERLKKSLKTAGRAFVLTSAAALALTACGPNVKENQLTGSVARVAPAEENAADTQDESIETSQDTLQDNEVPGNSDESVEAPNEPPVVNENRLTGEVVSIPCFDKEGTDKKTCCEAITDDPFMRKMCCDNLESTTELKCTEIEMPVRTAGVPKAPH